MQTDQLYSKQNKPINLLIITDDHQLFIKTSQNFVKIHPSRMTASKLKSPEWSPVWTPATQKVQEVPPGLGWWMLLPRQKLQTQFQWIPCALATALHGTYTRLVHCMGIHKVRGWNTRHHPHLHNQAGWQISPDSSALFAHKGITSTRYLCNISILAWNFPCELQCCFARFINPQDKRRVLQHLLAVQAELLSSSLQAPDLQVKTPSSWTNPCCWWDRPLFRYFRGNCC